MVYTRSETNVCDMIKKYLHDNESEIFCSKMCKVNHVCEMFDYMLSSEVKKTLLHPKFSKFCVTLMKKCDDLNREAEELKHYLGAWGLGGIETYNAYNKLIEKLLEMMAWLEDHGVPSLFASSKSPTKQVKPVSINNVKVLPRRSARLMEKKNANAVV